MQSRYVLLVLSCCLAVLTGCQTTTARDVTMPSASVASIPDNEPLAVVSDSHRLPLDTRLVMPKSEDELLQVLVARHQSVLDASIALFPRVRNSAWKRYLSMVIQSNAKELAQLRQQLRVSNGEMPVPYAVEAFPDLHGGSVAAAQAQYREVKADYDEILARLLSSSQALSVSASTRQVLRQLELRLATTRSQLDALPG